jgi:hypothetical protein
VYGAVALIVKLDDLGLVLLQNEGHMRFWKAKRWTGLAILASASGLMKTLSVAGTIAMFLVGGGILSHGVPMLHHVAVSGSQMAGTFPGIGRFLASMVAPVIDGLVGMLAGAVVVGLVSMGRWLLGKRVKGIAR